MAISQKTEPQNAVISFPVSHRDKQNLRIRYEKLGLEIA